MSNQSLSNIANEKQIAAYTSEFRENRLAKPVDISLTITAGHLHGRAYIWEREGTKEGDAEYQRFVCPLEEVTKVYINDNVKASPLYIQCDSHVNKVFHRKTIVVPCLENVAAIAEQINELHKKFMEKYEAKQQQEMERKREALAAERQKELAEAENKSPLPSLSAVKAPEPPKAPETPKTEKPAPATAPAVKPSADASVLTGDVAESLKALEKLESISAPPKKPELDLASIPDKAESSPVKPIPAPAPVIDELPPVPEIGEDMSLSALAPKFDSMQTEEEKPAPASESLPEMSVPQVSPVSAAPAAEPVQSQGLEGFERAVRALKARLDGGEISSDDFKAERKKLIAGLY
ncbi:MAG: hypothetical protein NC078_05280 [Ruminococcus sp.]|nr:hypothetical protein [Ruminococcus sp.]